MIATPGAGAREPIADCHPRENPRALHRWISMELGGLPWTGREEGLHDVPAALMRVRVR